VHILPHAVPGSQTPYHGHGVRVPRWLRHGQAFGKGASF
jgi:hypothetical protein